MCCKENVLKIFYLEIVLSQRIKKNSKHACVCCEDIPREPCAAGGLCLYRRLLPALHWPVCWRTGRRHVPRDDRGPRPVRLDRYRLKWSGGSRFSQVFTCIETSESSEGLTARQKPDVYVPLWRCFDMKQFQTISDLI